MKIYLLEEKDLSTWYREICYVVNNQSFNGISKGISYINCSEASSNFPTDIFSIEVNENLTAGDIIRKVTGEEVNFITFTLEELEEAIKAESKKSINLNLNKLIERNPSIKQNPVALEELKIAIKEKINLNSNKLLEFASAKVKQYPNISLICLNRHIYNDGLLDEQTGPTVGEILRAEKILCSREMVRPVDNWQKYEFIEDGDIFLIRRTSRSEWIYNVISQCSYELFYARQPIPLASATITNRKVFHKKLLRAETKDQVTKSLAHLNHPTVALFYTDEDMHVASYVRTHYDSLDKASGNDCDVLFIEDPSHFRNSSLYWREILDEISHLIWRSLGWENSQPYNKAEVYEIAKGLGIPIDMLPCAVTFMDGKIIPDSITKLEGNLTRVFSKIFSRFQKNKIENTEFDKSMPEPDILSITTNSIKQKNYLKPICFLSHNSNDKDIVRTVATSLHTFGIETWLDDWEILPGDNTVKEIEEGLGKASHFIIFLSEKAIVSNWVLEEMSTALYRAISTKRLRIIPVLIEECEIPLILRSYAHIRENEPHKIAVKIQHAVLGVTRKPPVLITS